MNSAVLRLLDANANRAREALRVLEDYARFVLDSPSLQAQLKSLRHDLTAAISPWVGQAILHRDTPGDVGTGNKTKSELLRQDTAHIVTAAGKRLGEALRCLEEFAKLEGAGKDSGFRVQGSSEGSGLRVGSPPRSNAAGSLQGSGTEGAEAGEPSGAQNPTPTIANRNPPIASAKSAHTARRIEELRYRFYAIEQTLALTLRPGADRFRAVRLYVLITESTCRRPWLQTAEQAILGGADCLQLREKDLDSGELLRRARQLVGVCRAHGILSIINDRPDIAVLSGADGVHLGQQDLPAREVRRIVGPEMLVGVSTHHLEQARQAVLDGADYIGVGPIFRSSTKARDFVAGPPYAREVAAASLPIPAVAIAGITEANVDEVLATGVPAVAVTAAVCAAEDPRAAAERLKRRLAGS